MAHLNRIPCRCRAYTCGRYNCVALNLLMDSTPRKKRLNEDFEVGSSNAPCVNSSKRWERENKSSASEKSNTAWNVSVCVSVVTQTSRGYAATKAKLQTTKVCLSTEYMVNQWILCLNTHTTAIQLSHLKKYNNFYYKLYLTETR